MNDIAEVSIVLCGEAGQGVQAIEQILTRVVKDAGYYVYATKEYMSRVRGGSNSTTIRISSHKVASYVKRVDVLIPLDSPAVLHMASRIGKDTIIIADTDKIKGVAGNLVHIPFSTIAADVGSAIYSNIIALAVLAAILRIDINLINENIRKYFSYKPEVIDKNIEAAKAGYVQGLELIDKKTVVIPYFKSVDVKDKIIMDGSTAVALGAIAGGCNFVAAYPMTPGSGVLNVLASLSDQFGVALEQVEDEISAVNMVIGAWYAGARAMTTTAGGGFALMVEGVSLAGMMESPLIVHIGQRPAPATGLPTRTEQGDLSFVINSGHGEFPRLVFAPSTLEDAFYLSQKAFNLAAKYQIPVFILTDQYFVDTYYVTDNFELAKLKVEKYLTESSPYYNRFELTSTGISPVSVPGYGAGFICADSDEHDETGHITEDPVVRRAMVDKRLRKFTAMVDDEVAPAFSGGDDYSVLVVAWGSTYNTILDALKIIDRTDVAYLHFSQVFPLPTATIKYLEKAKVIICIENNATGQLSSLIRQYTGVDVNHRILKYDGFPFSVEEVVVELTALV